MAYDSPSFLKANRTIDCFYNLADDIYLNFPILIKTISRPTTRREKLFATAKEPFRKAAERTYEVQFRQWRILANPSRIWHTSKMNNIISVV